MTLQLAQGLETLADAPPRCDRCDGPWRLTETGLSCLLCRRTLIVRAQIRRTLFERYGDPGE